MHTPAIHASTASTHPDPTWYTAARFGLFIHWGLYALPAGAWEGREVDYIGEWLQHGERIPCARYAAFARDFQPSRFNALAWVRAAKDAGMRYVVFTAKHHDGFALYHSAVDPFNVVDATPWGRDPLAELAAACRAEGMRLGIYYSHCVDWREAHAGSADLKEAGRMWGNDWEFPPGTADGFDEYLVRKAEPQLTELLSRYGDIALLWFDTPIATLTLAQAQRIHDLVRRLQPACLIGNRLGHGFGDIDGLGDNQAPRTPSRRPGEACVTLNETWGYKAHDHDWKNPAQVAGLLAACAAKDCNLLLNIGPQADGAFPAAALEILASIGTWLRQHGAAIYGTRGSPLPADPPGCAVTHDATHVHVFALDSEITEVVLNGCLPPLPPLFFDQTADAFSPPSEPATVRAATPRRPAA